MLVRLVLTLAARVDQHSAVECVAVPPWTFTRPRDAIHCRRSSRKLRPGILLEKFPWHNNNLNWTVGENVRQPREASMLLVKDIMRAREEEERPKCKKKSCCWVEKSHNKQLEPEPSIHRHASQPSFHMHVLNSVITANLFSSLQHKREKQQHRHTNSRANFHHTPSGL